MSTARLVEQRITRRLLARRAITARARRLPWLDRGITAVASLVVSGLLFLHLQEAFWALFLMALVFALGSQSGE